MSALALSLWGAEHGGSVGGELLDFMATDIARRRGSEGIIQ